MIAWKNSHSRILVDSCNVQKAVEDGGCRSFVARLHDSVGQAVTKVPKIVVPMCLGQGEQYSLRLDARFRPLPRLFKQRAFAEERTKLLRPVVAADQPCEPSQPDAVASGQDDRPAMRQTCCISGVRDRSSRNLFFTAGRER